MSALPTRKASDGYTLTNHIITSRTTLKVLLFYHGISFLVLHRSAEDDTSDLARHGYASERYGISRGIYHPK